MTLVMMMMMMMIVATIRTRFVAIRMIGHGTRNIPTSGGKARVGGGFLQSGMLIILGDIVVVVVDRRMDALLTVHGVCHSGQGMCHGCGNRRRPIRKILFQIGWEDQSGIDQGRSSESVSGTHVQEAAPFRGGIIIIVVGTVVQVCLVDLTVLVETPFRWETGRTPSMQWSDAGIDHSTTRSSNSGG